VQVEGAVMQALAKLPADRWATAQDLSDALTGAKVVTPPPLNAPAATMPARRSGWREMVAWGVALFGVAAAAWLATRATPAPVAGRFEIAMPESVTVSPLPGPGLALSRDGSMIVVVGVKDGRRALYLRRLDDLTARLVRGTDSALVPTFSPDGRWLLFHAGAGLKKVPVDGGTPQTVADTANPVPASWGDDGRILYVRGNRLWLVSSDGGAPHLLAGPDSSHHFMTYFLPEVLPGSRAALITIVRNRGFNADSAHLGVISLADGRVTDLGVTGSNPHYAAPGYVLFGRHGLWFAAPFSLGRLALTGAPSLLLDGVAPGGNNGARFNVGVASNGTLAFLGASSGVASTIYAVDRRGGVRALTRDPRAFQDARISPDGRHVVVRIGPGDFSGDLWVLDVATGALTRLTTDTSSIRGEWTRDGARVVYSVRKGSNTDRIVSRRWDRPDSETVLMRGPDIQEVALGPVHGLSAVREGGSNANPDILLAPTDSLAAVRRFITSPASEYAPRISPDGRLMAYTSNETGRSEVYLVSIPGPGPRIQVSVDGGDEAMWSPDGGTLYYRGPVRLMTATVLERPAIAVTRRDSLFVDTYERNAWHQAYDVFPNGREFLMTQGPHAVGKFYVMVNWPQLLGTQGRVVEER
jgi:serine/threonine-protein kinase